MALGEAIDSSPNNRNIFTQLESLRPDSSIV